MDIRLDKVAVKNAQENMTMSILSIKILANIFNDNNKELNILWSNIGRSDKRVSGLTSGGSEEGSN